MENRQKVLLVCSPSTAFQAFSAVLHSRGLEPLAAHTVGDAKLIFASETFALVICSAELLDGSYKDVLQLAGLSKTKTPVIVISRAAHPQECEEAKRAGAAECSPRPLCSADAEAMLNRVLRLCSPQQ